MSAVTLAASSPIIATSPTTSSAVSCDIPDALRQFLCKLEEQGSVDLRASADLDTLKADLKSMWQIASSEGLTSSTMLYQILEYGWKEWRRITA